MFLLKLRCSFILMFYHKLLTKYLCKVLPPKYLKDAYHNYASVVKTIQKFAPNITVDQEQLISLMCIRLGWSYLRDVLSTYDYIPVESMNEINEHFNKWSETYMIEVLQVSITLTHTLNLPYETLPFPCSQVNEDGVVYDVQGIDMKEDEPECSPQTGVPRFMPPKDNSTVTSRKVAPPRSKSSTDEKGPSKTVDTNKSKKLKYNRNKVRQNQYVILVPCVHYFTSLTHLTVSNPPFSCTQLIAEGATTDKAAQKLSTTAAKRKSITVPLASCCCCFRFQERKEASLKERKEARLSRVLQFHIFIIPTSQEKAQ